MGYRLGRHRSGVGSSGPWGYYLLHLPALPSATGIAAEIKASPDIHNELHEQYRDSLFNLFDLMVTNTIMPIITLLLGYLFGKTPSRSLYNPSQKEIMQALATFLVFGATGRTGKHFVSLALEEGHKIRALARNPAKLAVQHPNLQVRQGSIADIANLDELVHGVDFVISMLGDVHLQRETKINTAFVTKLIPAMRRHGVKRFLYQAGALSTPYKSHLPPLLWTIRHTLARGFAAQHQDNEAVMDYLVDEANDIEWMVHRAGIGSDGPSKGILRRSESKFSIATHRDCAAFNFRLLTDPSAIHTCDLSRYADG